MVFLAYSQKISERDYFLEKMDGASTLRCLYLPGSEETRNEESAVVRDLAELGALTMLMLLSGQYPQRWDPCVLQLLLNDFDLRSLDRNFVTRIHPSLVTMVDDMRRLGVHGDLASNTAIRSHAINYMNTDVSAKKHHTEKLSHVTHCSYTLGDRI